MITYNGTILKVGTSWLGTNSAPDPYNPLNLPPYTIRLQYAYGVTPTFDKGTGTQVSAIPNVWDLTYNSANWDSLLYRHDSLMSVLGANATGVTLMTRMFMNCSYLSTVALFDTSSVTNMLWMFYGCSFLTSVPLFDTSSVASSVASAKGMNGMFMNCSSLRTVPLFDTSSVTDMGSMFRNCDSLTSVPLFDTSSVTYMGSMFRNCSSLTSVPLFDTSSAESMYDMFHDCKAVQSGALALYTQASTQAVPPIAYEYCFTNCGINSTTGAAELAQIPSSWGGTGA